MSTAANMPALNRLGKWRTILTGWQLGTRAKGDPEGDAVRDHREATLILRAEVTAVLGILLKAGVTTLDDYSAEVEKEADLLCMQLEAKFPGFRATDTGMDMNVARAAETMKGWRP